jgi:hypothetical protein
MHEVERSMNSGAEPARSMRSALARILKQALLGAALVGAGLALQVRPALAQSTEVDYEQVRKDTDSLFESRFTIDDQDPERLIPSVAERNEAPLDFGYFLMNLSERADEASKRGDHEKAARYYRAVAKAVPENSVGFSKACAEYEAAGLIAEGVSSCAEALTRQGVKLTDYQRYVRLVLAKPGTLAANAVSDLDAVVEHLEASPETRLAGATAACAVALRLDDAARLARCASILRQGAPDDAQTIAYEWALAVKQDDQSAMERLVERARHSNMSKAAVKRLEDATREETSLRHRILEHSRPIVVGAALLGLVLLGLAIFLRLKRLPRRASA